jgi:hypothetical protein
VTRKMAAGGGLAIPLLSAELANTGWQDLGLPVNDFEGHSIEKQLHLCKCHERNQTEIEPALPKWYRSARFQGHKWFIRYKVAYLRYSLDLVLGKSWTINVIQWRKYKSKQSYRLHKFSRSKTRT